MSASDSTELLAGLLGFAAGVVFDHYVTPSVSYCYVPAHGPYQQRAGTPVRIPVESSCTRNHPTPAPAPAPVMSSNIAPKTDAQNIAALQALLQSQQQQALTAAYTGVAIGVLAVSAGVAIALLPKLMKKKKNRPYNRPAQAPPQVQPQPPQQPMPQSPATGVFAPIQGTAPQNPAASYPTTYSL